MLRNVLINRRLLIVNDIRIGEAKGLERVRFAVRVERLGQGVEATRGGLGWGGKDRNAQAARPLGLPAA